MNIKQLLSLANATPDEVATVDTPIGPVGYALVGSLVISCREEHIRAEDGADVFVHCHANASEARECFTEMVSELQAAVNGFAMDQFADALARTATPSDVTAWTV